MRLSTLHYLALLLGQMVFGADGNIQKTAMTGTRRLPVKDTTRSNSELTVVSFLDSLEREKVNGV
eukprot:m.97933 g.97933  ORF g.97933 m.97933 type:complete len:65 (+) comp36967_c1_seq10:238-432(+)